MTLSEGRGIWTRFYSIFRIWNNAKKADLTEKLSRVLELWNIFGQIGLFCMKLRLNLTLTKMSKVNFLSLVLHSLRVLSVLQFNVFFISLLYSCLLFFLFFVDENTFYLFLISLIIIFNFILFFVKSKNNIKELDSWESLIKDIKNII